MKEFFESHKSNLKSLMSALRHCPEIQAQIIDATSFLDSFNPTMSERCWHVLNNIYELQICPYCNESKRRFRKLGLGYFPTCGSKECQKAGASKGAKAARDWKAIKEKSKKTYLERTGYEHNSQNPVNKEKVKQTCIEKYGIDCACKLEKSVLKREKAIKEKYGSKSEMLKQNIISKYGSFKEFNDAVLEKRAKTYSENKFAEIKRKAEELGYEVLTKKPTMFEIELKCNRCGHIFHVLRDIVNHKHASKKGFCPKCDYKNMTFRSNAEKELGKALQEFYKGELQFNRKIEGREADIIIPEHMIAIDFNGIYWHTVEYKAKNMHKEKKIFFEDRGYNFLQIWEDDWNNPTKKEIILSMLQNKLGLSKKIYARKCEAKEVSGTDSKKFLEENHLHGWAPAKWKVGLYYEEEIVAIATFGMSRKLINGNSKHIELIRLCTKKGMHIIGGFSKLVKYAKEIFGINSFISYVDCDWTKLESNSYEKIGFEKVKYTDVNYYWCKDGIRFNRLNFTKDKLVKEGYDADKSEDEIMKSRGFKKLYGTGNLLMKWEWK